MTKHQVLFTIYESRTLPSGEWAAFQEKVRRDERKAADVLRALIASYTAGEIDISKRLQS